MLAEAVPVCNIKFSILILVLITKLTLNRAGNFLYRNDFKQWFVYYKAKKQD